MNKIVSFILSILLAFSIILASLITGVFYTSYNISYFNSFQKANSIDQATGKSFEYLEEVNEDTIKYLKVGDNSLLESHFNEKEILHMEDVFMLYELARKLLLISLAIICAIVIFSRFKRVDGLYINAAKTIFITFLVLIIFSVFIALDFNKYFTLFHHVFFDNDLWILDPRTDMMIQMMPLNFFIGHGIRIGIVTFLISIISGIILYFLGRKKERVNAIHRK